ncbi:MAG: twin-arginine translocase TatA/TatE family subunit [Anaerolineales bacterium]|nr:twin-arginine translocase TatA/TatE family subunit [Anaerolineales bacterium]MCB9110134.1 twin-arginine translocase TatA/TatE family subunit [Anaerolineales bacterium]
MFRLGGWEWIIILFIVILMFGPGRIGKVAGELGRSIKSFREGLSGDEDKEEEKEKSTSEEEKK